MANPGFQPVLGFYWSPALPPPPPAPFGDALPAAWRQGHPITHCPLVTATAWKLLKVCGERQQKPGGSSISRFGTVRPGGACAGPPPPRHRWAGRQMPPKCSLTRRLSPPDTPGPWLAGDSATEPARSSALSAHSYEVTFKSSLGREAIDGVLDAVFPGKMSFLGPLLQGKPASARRRPPVSAPSGRLPAGSPICPPAAVRARINSVHL